MINFQFEGFVDTVTYFYKSEKVLEFEDLLGKAAGMGTVNNCIIKRDWTFAA